MDILLNCFSINGNRTHCDTYMQRGCVIESPPPHLINLYDIESIYVQRISTSNTFDNYNLAGVEGYTRKVYDNVEVQ